ncbi:MAG TPA: right-handed parallel beta-helix repeat-containing protein, partial [Verrucomicrobiae bacterium]|nr:right-handed parallel beta-helix repeat-containing protein [Verrucomicrobiae bacterium]
GLEAATYYVAKTGNNNNAGTLTTPWLTIAKALSTASGGDTIYVRAGTYSEGDKVISGPSGSASAPTVLAAYQGESVQLIGSGNSGRVALDALSYFTIDGLTISNLNQGVYIRNGCHDIVVKNCNLGNVGQEIFRVLQDSYNVTLSNCFIHDGGVLASSNGEGVYIGTAASDVRDNTHHVVISSNIITRTKSESIEFKEGSHDCIAEKNVISVGCTTDYPASCIEVDNAATWPSNPNHIVRNNIIFDPGSRCHGIRAGTGVLIYNNIIWGISSGKYAVVVDNASSDSYPRRIYNNTMDVVSSRAISISGGTAYVTNNIGPSSAGNTLNDTAFYANAANHDYHLVPGTGVIDVGANLRTYVPADYDGNTRPTSAAFDMGAFEYLGVKPLPPQNLRLVSP